MTSAKKVFCTTAGVGHPKNGHICNYVLVNGKPGKMHITLIQVMTTNQVDARDIIFNHYDCQAAY